MKHLAYISICAAVSVCLVKARAEEPTFADFDSDAGSLQSPIGNTETLSLSARLGYGFRIGGNTYPGGRQIESQKYGSDNVLIEVEDHYLNYGQGLKVEIAGSYALMENLAGELALCFTGRVPRTVIEYDNASVPTSWEEKFMQASFGAKIMVVPRFRVLELVDMHVAWGLGIFFTSLEFENSDPVYAQNEGYVKTSPGLAFCGRVGAEYPVTDIFAITLDFSTEAVSFTLKEWRTPAGPTVYTTERNRSTSSTDVRGPTKIPGTNLALRLGVRFSIL